jgi:hypothetical protein
MTDPDVQVEGDESVQGDVEATDEGTEDNGDDAAEASDEAE